MPASDMMKGAAALGAALLISSNLSARSVNSWQTGQLPARLSTPKQTPFVAPRPFHDSALGIFL